MYRQLITMPRNNFPKFWIMGNKFDPLAAGVVRDPKNANYEGEKKCVG